MSTSGRSTSSNFAWRSVPDWVEVLLAVLLFVLALVSPSNGESYLSATWGIILALTLGAAAIWALATTQPVASVVEATVGLIIFIMPWLGGAHGGWAWTGWLLGILVVLVAAWSYFSMPTAPADRNLR